MTLREKTEDVDDLVDERRRIFASNDLLDMWSDILRMATPLPPTLQKALYITEWVINECDKDHRNVDPRDLHFDDLLDMTETALNAWDSGAR